jgi:hypothetical protein
MAGRRKTQQLQGRFGPEYDRAVNEMGSRGKAEAELQSRMEHVESLELKPVSREQEQHFKDEWQRVQAQFVNSPDRAVRTADDLVKEVMIARGYPTGDFDHRLAELSVDYPEITSNYRQIKEIKSERGQNGLTTEEMRQAMVLCKDLFEDLLVARAAPAQKS